MTGFYIAYVRTVNIYLLARSREKFMKQLRYITGKPAEWVRQKLGIHAHTPEYIVLSGRS
jgi:hypothetical protein